MAYVKVCPAVILRRNFPLSLGPILGDAYRRIDNPLTAPLLTERNVAVTPFYAPPNAEQPGTAIRLYNKGSAWLYQAEYRLGGIWTAQVISYDGGNGQRDALRFYEISSDGSGELNEITLVSSYYYLFNPSLATDNNDDLLVSFSMSDNASIFPEIDYTGRLLYDPHNWIDPNIVNLHLGTFYYTQGVNPTGWGDYSATALDPANGYVVWMFNELAKTNSTWTTWIGTAADYFWVYLPVILNNN